MVGSVKVVGLVERSDSPWFVGPLGAVLTEPWPCTFVPAMGRLGYFAWDRAPADSVPKTARWMWAPRQLDMLDWMDAQNTPQKRASESLAAF
jgi:hypothetical protein